MHTMDRRTAYRRPSGDSRVTDKRFYNLRGPMPAPTNATTTSTTMTSTSTATMTASKTGPYKSPGSNSKPSLSNSLHRSPRAGRSPPRSGDFKHGGGGGGMTGASIGSSNGSIGSSTATNRAGGQSHKLYMAPQASSFRGNAGGMSDGTTMTSRQYYGSNNYTTQSTLTISPPSDTILPGVSSSTSNDLAISAGGLGATAGTRRRPRRGSERHMPQPSGTAFSLGRQLSDGSLDPKGLGGALPEAPSLWKDNPSDDEGPPHHYHHHNQYASINKNNGSVPDMKSYYGTPPLRPRRTHNVPIGSNSGHTQGYPVDSMYMMSDPSERNATSNHNAEGENSFSYSQREDYNNYLVGDHHHHVSYSAGPVHRAPYYKYKYDPSEAKPLSPRRPFYRRIPAMAVVQLLVVGILLWIIRDSHLRGKRHKELLEDYGDERAELMKHLLWMEETAKRLAKQKGSRGGGFSILDEIAGKNPDTETKDELVNDTKALREKLEELELRIIMNARFRIADSFGDSPLQISLKLPPTPVDAAEAAAAAPVVTPDEQDAARAVGGDDDAKIDGGGARPPKVQHEVLVSLTNDTPHAVSTLLQQMEKDEWRDLSYSKVDGDSVIQVSSRSAVSRPMLEFAEKSTGCHEQGSVALRSTVRNQLNTILLRIYLMDHDEPLHENDVCIGKVIDGFEYLTGLHLSSED